MAKKKLLVPEIIQTSNMDCGPACLKSLGLGFGVDLNYDAIRTLCQTDVDGTAIDDLQDVLEKLQFETKQHISPLDHIFLNPKEHFPAIGLIKLPNDALHFNVYWSAFGNYYQLMDPAHGRYYMHKNALRNRIFLHKMKVNAKEWYEYATTEEFLAPLRARTEVITGSNNIANQAVDAVLGLKRIYPLMAFDASVRFVDELLIMNCLKNTKEASALIGSFWKKIHAGDFKIQKAIPKKYWYAIPEEYADEFDELFIQGPVFLTILDKKKTSDLVVTNQKNEQIDLKDVPVNPVTDLLMRLKDDSLVIFMLLFVGIFIGSMAMFAEAMLFRGVMNLSQVLSSPIERLKIFAGLSSICILVLLLNIPLNVMLFRTGRKFDIIFRLAFFDKLKVIKDEYFSNRLSSDILQRIHNIYRLRELPNFLRVMVELVAETILLTIGLSILFPEGALYIVAFAFVQIFVPLLFLKPLGERDLSVQTHLGALQRFNLDALQGLDTLRSHSAEKSLQFEFDQLLAKWKSSQLKYINLSVLCNTVLSVIGLVGFCLLTYYFLVQENMIAEAFLFAYWALSLNYISRPIIGTINSYNIYKNMLTRLSEPLNADEDLDVNKDPLYLEGLQSNQENIVTIPRFDKGVSLQFIDFTVVKSNRKLLENINININSGEHIAIVGRSGAGKSTILGTILGWIQPTFGKLLINGSQLPREFQSKLYEVIAWIDPDIMLWNRTLLENIRYGAHGKNNAKTDTILNAPFMLPIIEGLPQGSQSKLGEQGSYVSGGEGQRIRFGRALNQGDIKLVIMDEPFRGLEGDTRKDLLKYSRKEWKNATMLCVLHDIRLALSFDKILVIENGKVIEFDTPKNLLTRESRVKALYKEEKYVFEKFWTNTTWKHLTLQSRGIVELDKKNLGYDLHKNDLAS